MAVGASVGPHNCRFLAVDEVDIEAGRRAPRGNPSNRFMLPHFADLCTACSCASGKPLAFMR
jgi:hypothetical protein